VPFETGFKDAAEDLVHRAKQAGYNSHLITIIEGTITWGPTHGRLLQTKQFFTCLCHFFLAAGACLSWGLPSHSCRSLSSQGSIYGPLTHVLATLAVLAEESLTQASVQTPSQTLLWMNDKVSSPCLKTWGTHRSRHSKGIDNTSLTFIRIHSYWQGPASVFSSALFDWQHNSYTSSSIPCPGSTRYTQPSYF